MASDTDDGMNFDDLILEDDSCESSLESDPEALLQLPEQTTASLEPTIKTHSSTSELCQITNTRHRATSCGEGTPTLTQESTIRAPISRVASTSSDGALTTSGQDVKTSSSQDVTTSSIQDVTTSSGQDVTTSSSLDVTTSSSQDVRTSSGQDVTTSSGQDVTTSSGQDVTTSTGQDVKTSSSQDVTTSSSLVTVRSGPRSICPVGGSVTTDTAHVTKQASGDEVLQLVGAFVKEAEKSDYDCSIVRREEGRGKEVHVHLTKTVIHQPKAVTMSGDVYVGPPPQKVTHNPGPPSHLKRLRNKTEKTLNTWTEDMVITKSTVTILNKIAKGSTWVTVTGCPGEGKTTAGYLVLKHLHNRGREVFDVKTPDDYFTAKGVGQSVILLNDIFGELIFDSDSFMRWQSVLSDVLALSEHKQGFIDKINRSQKQNIPDVTVIFICRSSILREASRKMGKFKHLVLKEDNMVDLTEMIELDVTERMKIWNCHAEKYVVNIDKRIVREVCSMKLSYGFPHCCRLFADMYKKNKSLNMKHFFLKPLKFLNQSMEALMEDSITGPMLRQMLKNDGSLDLEEIEDHEKRYQYSSVAKTMIGTYFVLNERKIEFHHPSIYDSAAFLICQMDPQFVISFCSLSFLNERVRLKDLTKSTVTQTHQTISVENGFEKILLERLLKEFQDYDISGVLSHESFHDESFVSKFMQKILSCQPKSTEMKDMFNVHDKQLNKSFLYLMTKSGSDKILRYIHQYVELTEDEQSEAVFGICEHSSVSSLGYLLERYKNINLEVTDSDNQTPLLVSTKHSSHDMIRILLTMNVNVNALDNQERTPLLNICKNGVDGDGSVVLLLLEKGAYVTPQSLLIACEAGYTNVAKCLLDNGADINETDEDGWTPLHAACWNGQVYVVRELLDKGADSSKTDVAGYAGLHVACWNGQVDVVTVLLDKGADVNNKDGSGSTPLHCACVNGHVDVVTTLLERGADINKTDGAGFTCLQYACCNGHDDVVIALLENGADINKTDGTGMTSLHHACCHGRDVIVTILLNKGVDVNAMNDGNVTPLQLACWKGHYDVLTILLDKGADINRTDNAGMTLFHRACYEERCEAMRVLLDKGADINKSDEDCNTPLYRACANGHVHVVSVLLDKGADVNKTDGHGLTPLHAACLHGHADIVTLLLAKDADINKSDGDSFTPLQRACSSNHVDVVTVLLDKGADMHKPYGSSGLIPLQEACLNLRSDVLTVLLEKGADINKLNGDGYTLLHGACVKERIDVVNLILDKGADINKVACGSTALHLACVNGYIDVVTLLLDKGADINITTDKGVTPMQCACCYGHVDVVTVLVDRGADIDKANWNGRTPFQAACLNGHLDVVTLLLDKGVDINKTNCNGQTPLHRACSNGHVDVVTSLLDKGVDINRTDGDGCSPLHTACSSGHVDVVRILLDKGADVNIRNTSGMEALALATKHQQKAVQLLLLERH